MSFETTYQFHGRLLVKIERDRCYPFFDSYLDKVFSRYEVQSSAVPDLVIRLDGREDEFKNCFWVDGKYAVRKNFIGYKNKFKSARWTVAIDGLESPQMRVHIGANLFARPVLAGETLYSLIRFKLLQKEHALLHASGIGAGGKGFFFAARGGVGKTITAIRSVHRGAVLYGDDTVIISDSSEMLGFAVPFNLRFTYDIEKMLDTRFPFLLRMEIGLKKFFSLITFGRYRLFTILPPEKIFPKALGDKVSLGAAFVLMAGDEFKIEEEKNRDFFLDQLVKIIQFESSELIPMLLAYAHIFPEAAFFSFWDRMKNVLNNALNGLPCYRVTIPGVYKEEYFENLWEKLNSCKPSVTTSTV